MTDEARLKAIEDRLAKIERYIDADKEIRRLLSNDLSDADKDASERYLERLRNKYG